MGEHSLDRRAKKDSFFGIDTDERIEKFLNKFQKMIHKHVYGETKKMEDCED
jgi:hypothetical protein